MTPNEKAIDIIQKMHEGANLEDLITAALTPAVPTFSYRSTVSDEEFDGAMLALQRAIEVKDTPEEWAKFTGQTLLVVGKLAVGYFGFGPAITLLESIFGENHELIALVKLIGETYEDV